MSSTGYDLTPMKDAFLDELVEALPLKIKRTVKYQRPEQAFEGAFVGPDKENGTYIGLLSHLPVFRSADKCVLRQYWVNALDYV